MKNKKSYNAYYDLRRTMKDNFLLHHQQKVNMSDSVSQLDSPRYCNLLIIKTVMKLTYQQWRDIWWRWQHVSENCMLTTHSHRIYSFSIRTAPLHVFLPSIPTGQWLMMTARVKALKYSGNRGSSWMVNNTVTCHIYHYANGIYLIPLITWFRLIFCQSRGNWSMQKYELTEIQKAMSKLVF